MDRSALKTSLFEAREISIGFLLRIRTVDGRLLPAKSIAFGNAALRGDDAAPAAPAQAVPDTYLMHLVQRMMCPAAVAESGFLHRNLAAEKT